MKLPKELKEISGMIYHNNNLYAITDNTGSLFQLNVSNGEIMDQWQFAKADDYEDLAIAEGKFYVLNSNGNLLSFSISGEKKPDVQQFEFPFGKNNEFEILYYDESIKQLVMICKECKADNKGSLSVYTIDPLTGKYAKAAFAIEAEEVAKKSGRKTERIKPSAASVHPITGEIYMISSINKMLVRLNREGRVLSASSIKRSVFEQPEGLTFTHEGHLLISNEAGKKERATLLLIKKGNQ
ncbi:MAG: SdiA-regulated domain-containing protein [Chitinophagaceae bacterium]